LTSPPKQIQIECPECRHEYEDWYRPSINATLDPELVADEDYLREASTATCPRCGHVLDLDGILLAKMD
jgi:hypothetical protein